MYKKITLKNLSSAEAKKYSKIAGLSIMGKPNRWLKSFKILNKKIVYIWPKHGLKQPRIYKVW